MVAELAAQQRWLVFTYQVLIVTVALELESLMELF